jgi:hypothetical protein
MFPALRKADRLDEVPDEAAETLRAHSATTPASPV